jgi:hypothetical protein
MGNCCGSQSAYDDTAPTQPSTTTNTTARPQKRANAKPSGPGYTLGGPAADTTTGPDPRAAAALAAQV